MISSQKIFRIVTWSLFLISLFVATITHTKGMAMGASDSVVVTDKHNGSKITVKKGAILILKLNAQIGTGYSWKISHMDSKKLQSLGESQVESGEQEMPGAAEQQVFGFKAIGSGVSTLELQYVRPWEQGSKPEKIYSIKVQVTKSKKTSSK